ncbi:hypothetical protein PHLGIDRAFT_119764 [Phlebiopsis gigantea 11061_1 CR5-6]|uniref:SWIM-type domain-containing protein n=1 Tax=Phlebiopsis gigantea (strain 11061_1 CR5-6) TaxID=745531 RepID=A0A0C3S8Q2_PHLG1|nr:hypothetical protein PHLGIDRAFT_119764 [Phlebiopsis gigantea 11061_1 CR5-6]
MNLIDDDPDAKVFLDEAVPPLVQMRDEQRMHVKHLCEDVLLPSQTRSHASSSTSTMNLIDNDPNAKVFLDDAVPPLVQMWDERRMHVKILTSKMFCSPEQRTEIDRLHTSTSPDLTSRMFAESAPGQDAARQLLKSVLLDKESLAMLESKWSKVWSHKWSTKTGSKVRTLYQCVCGYDTQERQNAHQKGSSDPAKRRTGHDYTGCLGHADVTESLENGAIIRVIAYLHHNEACRVAQCIRTPRIPLHPHVVDTALRQFSEGGSINHIQQRNVAMVQNHTYRGMDNVVDPTSCNPLENRPSNWRYSIFPDDFHSLYRQHNKQAYRIDLTIAQEYNVDNWLDPKSTYFKPELQQAVFKYMPRAEEGERVKVCIANEEMRQAAWKYCHTRQLVLDGTFGVASSRLLLWIALAINERGEGVPVALFLFSAPTGNKATHAGYNTNILAELLKYWRDWLDETAPPKTTFSPCAAITDTDVKERGALIRVWDSIILLLCRFHVRQCWTNKRNSVLGKESTPERDHVEKRLQNLEYTILRTAVHAEAQNLLDVERRELQDLSQLPKFSKPVNAGIRFLDYLVENWMQDDLWKGWSMCARHAVAKHMNITVDQVLTTTNHLESLNKTLKWKYLPQWQHSGYRLRFDVLLYHLCVTILPHEYAKLRMFSGYEAWLAVRFPQVISTAARKSNGKSVPPPSSSTASQAWYSPDSKRDQEAKIILQRHLITPIPAGRFYELWATCRSSRDPTLTYHLTIHPSGSATCSCPDWIHRSGACKHLRAFREVVQGWMQSKSLTHPYIFPGTAKEAEAVEATNKRWYGEAYLQSVLQPGAAHVVSPTKTSGVQEYTTDSGPPPPLTHKGNTLPPHNIADTLPSDLDLQQYVDISTDSSAATESPASPRPSRSPSPVDIMMVDSKKAIATQIDQHVRHDIQRVLPLLHGLVNTMSDLEGSITTTCDLEEFKEVIDQLAILKKKIDEPDEAFERGYILHRAAEI